MPDERSVRAGQFPELTAAEITHLRNLGRSVRSAPGYRAIQDALDTALRAALRHRHEGVGWHVIVRALGIAEEELRHRLRETTDKPHEPSRPTMASPGLSVSPEHDSPASSGPSTSARQHTLGSISASMSQDMTSSGTIPAHATPNQGTIGLTGISRRVLFLSGDPRPGRNDFGSEAACIRQALVGSFVQLIEMGSVQLAEICTALEHHTPAVLHIAAHSAFGGVHLTQEGSDLSIAYRDLCTQIARVRSPPRLVILNVCDSTAMADQMARTIAAVISWPSVISDDQARIFTRQFYRSLAGRRSIADSCKDSEAALTGPHPDCPPPVVHGLAGNNAF